MSNWPHWEIIYSPLALPAVPREVILSTCLHFLSRSSLQTAHAAVVLPVLSRWWEFITSVWRPAPWRLVISSYLRMISWVSARLFSKWPKTQVCAGSWDYSANQDVMHPLLQGPAQEICLFACPPQENSSLLFVWLNYYAGFTQGKGWVALRLTISLPSFCVIYYTVHLPACPSLGVNPIPSANLHNWELSPDRHTESLQTPVGPKHAKTKKAAHDTLPCLYAPASACADKRKTRANSRLQSHFQQNRSTTRQNIPICGLLRARALNQVSNHMRTRETWHIFATLKRTTRSPRGGKHKRVCWALTPARTFTHTTWL